MTTTNPQHACELAATSTKPADDVIDRALKRTTAADNQKGGEDRKPCTSCGHIKCNGECQGE